MIELKFARIDFTSEGAVSYFPDGTSWGATPHDTAHYHHLAFKYGHEGDTLAYCHIHELCHHLVAEEFGRPSAVLSFLAKGMTPPRLSCASEEALAMALHLYAMTGEPPFIDRVDWPALRERMRKHLAEAC